MKNLSKYAVIGLLAMLLGLTACGNSKKETVDNRQTNPEMEKVHSEGEAKEVMLTRSRGENSDHCVKRTWSSDSNTSRVKQPAIALKTHVQSAARSVYMSEGSPVQEA